MSVLDVFSADGFTTASLTNAINVLAKRPGMITRMNLFQPKGIMEKTAYIERRGHTYTLLTSSPWGAPGTVGSDPSRKIYPVSVPHIRHNDQVLAADLIGIRSFGTDSMVDTVGKIVLEKLQSMRWRHELTHEFHYAGALQGKVYDGATATLLADLWTILGLTQTSVDFVFGTATTDIKGKIDTGRNTIDDAMGGIGYTRLVCLCGGAFYNSFTNHAIVKAAFDRWQDGAFLRDDLGERGFEYNGVTFYRYRSKIGSTYFLPNAEAVMFPVGVPELFVMASAPATWEETVGLPGRLLNAKQYRLDERGTGQGLETQSNSIPMCSIPECLIRCHSST
jgi:hypothetical protein